MKKQIALVTVFSAVFSFAQGAQSAQRVTVPVTQVFAPIGFDSNDSSEIVVAGYLPNLCYKVAHADTAVTGKSVKIEVTALKSDSELCLQMIIPFLEVATLGVLDKGDYAVTVNPGFGAKTTELPVVESTSSAIDDYVYANVSSIERIHGTRRVLLKGENPSPCYELDGINAVSNGKDAYSVLPVLKQVSPMCPQVLIPFEYEFTVPTDLAVEKLLLHVRVMNGKSVNSLFYNR
jgi:hypothetical protein